MAAKVVVQRPRYWFETTQTTHGHRVDKCYPLPKGGTRREAQGTYFTEADAAEFIQYETARIEITS